MGAHILHTYLLIYVSSDVAERMGRQEQMLEFFYAKSFTKWKLRIQYIIYIYKQYVCKSNIFLNHIPYAFRIQKYLRILTNITRFNKRCNYCQFKLTLLISTLIFTLTLGLTLTLILTS